jgi:hypothetical protein
MPMDPELSELLGPNPKNPLLSSPVWSPFPGDIPSSSGVSWGVSSRYAMRPAPDVRKSPEVPRCYRADKPCDGSCGRLLPCGACVELLLASARYR